MRQAGYSGDQILVATRWVPEQKNFTFSRPECRSSPDTRYLKNGKVVFFPTKTTPIFSTHVTTE